MLMSNSNDKLYQKYTDHTDNFEFSLKVTSLIIDRYVSVRCIPVCKHCNKELLPLTVLFYDIKDLKEYMEKNIQHTKKECGICQLDL